MYLNSDSIKINPLIVLGPPQISSLGQPLLEKIILNLYMVAIQVTYICSFVRISLD